MSDKRFLLINSVGRPALAKLAEGANVDILKPWVVAVFLTKLCKRLLKIAEEDWIGIVGLPSEAIVLYRLIKGVDKIILEALCL